MKRRLKAGSDERGQATVELALVTPILMLMVVGVFEFGRAWNEYQVITDATREAARNCAVASANGAMAADTVEKTVTYYLNNAGMTVPAGEPSVTGFRSGTGNPCTVTLTVPYTFVFVGALLEYASGTETIDLSSSATMRNE